MSTREECLTDLANYLLEVLSEPGRLNTARDGVVSRLATSFAGGPGVRLLRITEVAERLSVGDDWVYERINRGEIPVVELGDTRKNQRIRESDLDSFIAARTYGGPAM